MYLSEIDYNINEEILAENSRISSERAITSTNSFIWSPAYEIAANYIAAGLKNSQITFSSGLTYKELSVLRRNPVFMEKVDDLIYDKLQEVKRLGVAIKANRILGLNELQDKLQIVIDERSQQCDPLSPFFNDRLSTIPGMSTGLIVAEEKSIGMGVTVLHSKVDTSIMKSIIEINSAVSEELGQKSTTINHNIKAYGFDTSIM